MNTKDDEFVAVFVENYDYLVKYSKTILGGSQDLVHKAFIKCMEKEFDIKNFKNSMRAIIRNIEYNDYAAYRGRCKDDNGKITVNQFFYSYDGLLSTSNPELEAAKSEMNRKFQSFIRKLPIVQAKVFRAIYFGKSIQECARESGKTEDSIKRAYRESYLKAREHFKKDDYFQDGYGEI